MLWYCSIYLIILNTDDYHICLSLVFNIIKERFGSEYEMWKCGEKSRAIDRRFDKVTPYYMGDFNQFLRLVNNSHLVIGTASGPHDWATVLGIPVIDIEEPLYRDSERRGTSTKESWQNIEGVIGDTYYDWMDSEKMIIFWKEHGVDGIDDKKILGFCEKWLE